MPNELPQRLGGGALPCLLSVPTGEPPATGWPVICFLHGYDEAAPMPIEQGVTAHGPLHPRNPAAVRNTFMIIAPQMPQAGDVWHRFADAVDSLVGKLLRQHDGDPYRCYLSGFSFGGNGVFDLALTHPERWAALWPVDPTRLPREPIEAPIWLSIGQVARRLKTRFIESMGLEPVTVEHIGERVYLDEGADHVDSARLAYRDERAYAWLLRHRRSA